MTGPGDAMIEAIAEAVALKLERMNGVQQRLMEIEEAAKYLGMTVPALRHKVATGEIPVVRIDNKLRFDRRDLDRYIDQAKREGI
jgi:excisionase family DNA binding protein